VSNWPRLVQIAWCAFDSQHRELESASHIIRPDGFEIRPDSTAIHGITQDQALAEGLPIQEVLGELQRIAAGATSVIAHNASFDGSVIAAEYVRLRKMPPFLPKDMVCTMEASTDFCRLPGGPRGYKWPRLDELYAKLFEASFDGAHDAGVDAKACADCFFELQKRGVIELG
jgi:DNA polymerase III epsilon subunit-like protein